MASQPILVLLELPEALVPPALLEAPPVPGPAPLLPELLDFR